MSESVKCPRCSELLNRDSAISHLTVVHQVGLRDAVRWAGLNVDVNLVGQGDGAPRKGG